MGNHGRILALDYGKRRIGLALSDELGITAQGLPTLVRTNKRSDMAMLSNLISSWDVTRVVVGNPLHMSGEVSPLAEEASSFADLVAAHCGVEVQLWDERLTTREASRVLRESGLRRGKRKQVVDKLAAVLILQSYLDYLSSGGLPEAGPGA